VILKIFPKAGNDIYTGENRPLTPKESQSDAAFKQSSVFSKNQVETFKLFFAFTA
jgi:hypothetical protein